MATKKLAKRLGLLRQRSQNSSGSKKSVISNEIFSYLIVIDFESTCWRDKNNYGQEIIEFPAVLLNTSTGEVESEFHTYIQPQEHPILSEFCTELTGITQVQVEAGIPLQICLSRFHRWLQSLQLEKGVTFPNKQQICSAPSPSQKLCTFLTWSDWDLGVCLQYECKRKQLHKPEVLNNWIDLRTTYRLFYNRKPKGLNGALQDLGIQFSGREHSGLDDARNTARLAVRMVQDGCVMKITRSLERTSVTVRAKFGNNVRPEENKKGKPNMNKKENVLTSELSSSSILFKDGRKRSCLFPQEASSSVQRCRSLISPKTLLNNSKEPPWGQNDRTDAAQTAASTSTVNSSHVLCSTTVSSFSHLPQPDQVLQTGLLDEEEEAELLVETEERCSSYDDVLLECDVDVINETDKERSPEYVSDFDSGCSEWDDHARSPEGNVTLEDNARRHANTRNSPRMQNNVRDSSLISKSMKTSKSHVNCFNNSKESKQNSATNFAVPQVVDWGKLNHTKAGHSPQLQLKLDGPHKSVQTNIVSSVWSKPFRPEKTSTPNTSTTRHKPVITKRAGPLKSPFTIHTEPMKKTTGSSRPSSFGSWQFTENILFSLSTNTLSSCAGRKGQRNITSPLCACGRRAKRQVVTNGGPNHGRGFYCCPVRRSGGGGCVEKGCEFFKWESAVMKSSSAEGCSRSLCQISSALPHQAPPRKSY
ncbi:ERI1 exoribonuclease 2 [Kryptolebias marmoratus]|uniref:ERI1 exoribonuclease 2 n=1 Tax=Kryptolebias marmoratus TaxID=37003 RepID=A0A3Q3AMN3_KRYMA|nr:ERI1 exoribonuclease 2 [Kryptolebias marmoratus]